MKRALLVGLVALVPLLTAPAQRARPTPEALVRAAGEAFARNDPAAALALLEQAEERATDPGLVAYNMATARYQLAGSAEGQGAPWREAELLYRCCLGESGPRKARAYLGLGNCLLQRAALSNPPAAAELRAAVTCFDRCLRLAGGDGELRAAAGHNRQRARLLLVQSAAPPAAEEGSSGDDPEKQSPPPEKDPSGDDRKGRGRDGRSDGGDPVKAKAGPGEDLQAVEAEGGPGAGALPAVPDTATPTPLTPADAAQHLEQAARRMAEDRQAHRRSRQRPPSSRTRNW